MNYFSTILLSLKFNLDADYKPKINVRYFSFPPLFDRVRPQLLRHLFILCFPKSMSKHKKFTGKPSTKLPFPKLPLRASQEIATCDRPLCLPKQPDYGNTLPVINKQLPVG